MKTLACIAVLFAAALAAPSEPQIDFSKLTPAIRLVDPIGGPKDIPAEAGGRIVGGQPAAQGEIPFQAALNINGRSFCGGSLIGARWVLTAAHCAVKGDSVTVYLGSIRYAQSPVIITSSNVINHPQYNGNVAYDVTVINLGRDVALNANIQPVKLAKGSDLYVGSNARVSGFGLTQPGGSVSATLNKVSVTVITNAACRLTYGSTIQDYQICSKDLNGAVGNSCNGDSGGPLVDLSSGKQIGVVSFGSSSGCLSGDPKGLSRVTYFVGWIEQTTGLQF